MSIQQSWARLRNFSLRYWLIEKLAGHRTIAINLRLTGGGSVEISEDGALFVNTKANGPIDWPLDVRTWPPRSESYRQDTPSAARHK